MTSDRPEDPDGDDRPETPGAHPDRRDDQASDGTQAARPTSSSAETRSRSEYYIDLRTKVSAQESAVAERALVDEQAAEQKWQKDSTESREIWVEYQRKWPPADRTQTDRPSSPAASRDDRSRSLDDATNSRVEMECDRIADRERDKITPALRAVESQDPDRQLIGFKHRLKGRDRIKEKVDDKMKESGFFPEEAVSRVSDTIRYTFQYREDHYSEGVWSDIRRLKEYGFELSKIKNSWSSDQYKGVNSQWLDRGTGQRFEVQFHTRISFEAKQLTHDAYEHIRNRPSDKLEQLVLEAFQRKVTGEVPVPLGATDIPDYP